MIPAVGNRSMSVISIGAWRGMVLGVVLAFFFLTLFPPAALSLSFVENVSVLEMSLTWSGKELESLGKTNADFLQKAYLLVLDRKPTPDELTEQSDKDFGDTQARNSFIRSLCYLPEFSERMLPKLVNDEQFPLLKKSFQAILRRDPNPVETHKCIWALRKGTFFLKEFPQGQAPSSASTEKYPENCINGILQRLDEFAGLSDVDFLKALFSEKFQREPTLHEYAFYLGGIPYGLTTRQSVTVFVRRIASDDPQGAQKKTQKAFDQVQAWFTQYQNASLGPEEAILYVGALYYGQLPPEEIIAKISGKPSVDSEAEGPKTWKKDLFFDSRPSQIIEFDMSIEDLSSGQVVDEEVFKLTGGALVLIKVITGKDGLTYEISVQGKKPCYRSAKDSHRFRVEWTGTETAVGDYLGTMFVHYDGAEVVKAEISQYPAIGFIGVKEGQGDKKPLAKASWNPVSGL